MDIKNPCTCCLIRQSEKDLKATNTWLDKNEVYADMLKECFEINVACEVNEYGICELCISRLRDALDFKHQVMKCQKDLLLRTIHSIKDEEGQIKVENTINSDDDDHHDDAFDNYMPEFHEITLPDKIVQETSNVKEERPKKKTKSVPRLKTITKTRLQSRRVQSDSDRMIVKQITQRYVEKVLAERQRLLIGDTLQKNTGTRREKKLKVSLVQSDCTALIRRKYKFNIENIIKYSNCTPFKNKTLNGYCCAFCSETFADPKVLREHTKGNHKEDTFVKYNKDVTNLGIKIDITDLKCGICEQHMSDIKALKSHLHIDHKKRFHMDIKDYVLEFKLTSEEFYNCVHCTSTFETFKMLLQHMNNHYRNFICESCGMGFINMYKLKVHKTCHESGQFNCQFCEKVFPTQTKKAYHEKFTHTRVRYNSTCPHCNESFTSYYKRNQHMVKVHNTSAASYKCNICDRSFLLKAQLTNHTKKVHLMERNHVCTECGQGFYQKQYLKEHMIRHNGERIHKCEVCHKSYARKKTLREHMRIHNDDRRHKCPVCGLGFVQKCSMKSHLLSNHGLHLNAES